MIAHQAFEVVLGKKGCELVEMVDTLRRAADGADVGRRADQDEPPHELGVAVRKTNQKIAAARVSIGTEWGPRIGLQKGPLCG